PASGLWHPVAFWSHKFAGAELNYSTPDQEMMAIVCAFERWRHYLEGSEHPVEVLSDHQNLQSFMAQQRLNRRQARWCMFLAPFDFVIRHRDGKSNPADAPSRRPDYQSEDAPGTELLNPLQQRLAPTPSVLASAHINHVSVAAMVGMTRTTTRSQARAAATAAEHAAGDHLVYDSQAQESLVELLRKTQADDPWTQRIKSAIQEERSDLPAWSISPTGLLLW